jgi:pimeloyl-ACP methyl ester carboxylesterase
MTADPPVILLSGMGADDRVFSGLKGVVPRLSVPQWPKPKKKEPLRDYARRFAAAIDPGVPCFVGGASFGGFVALEMIPYLQTEGCFLVGSLRSARELPAAVKTLRGIASTAVGAVPFEATQLLSALVLSSSRPMLGNHLASLCEQLSASSAGYLRWASWAVLNWDGPETDSSIPIYQIHGGNDRVLPVHWTHPDVIVNGAGHALSMSHPEAVAQFILGSMRARRRCHRE